MANSERYNTKKMNMVEKNLGSRKFNHLLYNLEIIMIRLRLQRMYKDSYSLHDVYPTAYNLHTHNRTPKP